MQIRPKILLSYGRQQEPIRVPLSNLTQYAPTTYVSGSVAAGIGSVPVQNGTLASTYLYAILGMVGSQNSELVTISSVSGNTISTSAPLYSHQDQEPVIFLNVNQVEISWNATASPVGNSILTTITLNPYFDVQTYYDTANTAGYYFARWKGAAFTSPYSSPAPYGGYTLLSARAVIDKALSSINHEDDGDRLPDEFFFGAIDDCQTECLREYKRWSFMQKFNFPVAQAQTGDIKVAVPADLDDQNTTRSIYQFRIGKEDGLVWVDKEEWDGLMQGIAYTTLTQQVNIGDAVLNVQSANDFYPSGGTVQCGPTQFTYTSTTATTLVLGTTSTVSVPVNTDVTLGMSLGYPVYFTVWGGYAYFFPGIGSSYSGRNYYMDYYSKQLMIQNDSDQIILPDPTVVQYYLQWKALLRIANGKSTSESELAFKKYMDRREKMKQKEWINYKTIWKSE